MKEVSNVKEFTGEENDEPIKNLVQDRTIEEKSRVLAYMKSFKPDCAAGMSLKDEMTGEVLDSGVSGYEDGVFYWDTRHIYHFEKYNLKLNDDFIEHVLRT